MKTMRAKAFRVAGGRQFRNRWAAVVSDGGLEGGGVKDTGGGWVEEGAEQNQDRKVLKGGEAELVCVWVSGYGDGGGDPQQA